MHHFHCLLGKQLGLSPSAGDLARWLVDPRDRYLQVSKLPLIGEMTQRDQRGKQRGGRHSWRLRCVHGDELLVDWRLLLA